MVYLRFHYEFVHIMDIFVHNSTFHTLFGQIFVDGSLSVKYIHAKFCVLFGEIDAKFGKVPVLGQYVEISHRET